VLANLGLLMALQFAFVIAMVQGEGDAASVAVAPMRGKEK